MWNTLAVLGILVSVVAGLWLLFVQLQTSSPRRETENLLSPPVLLPSSTFHSRFKPLLHSFRYPVLYIGIDLDSVGYFDRVLSFSDKIWRPLTLRAHDYLGTKYAGTIKEKLWSHLKDHEIDTSRLAKAFLVTTPRLLGYSFNPVSFHYVYNTTHELAVIVLEVNNTFGEKHIYVLKQEGALAKVRQGYSTAQTFPRRFHVSPFNDRSGSYQLQCFDPFESPSCLKVDMHLTLLGPVGTKKLTAQVNSICAAIPTNDTGRSLWALARHGTAVFLTVPRILTEAWKLHYSKKLAVYLRPEPFEELSAIGRQLASPTDLYFKDLVVAYLRSLQPSSPVTVSITILPTQETLTIGGSEVHQDDEQQQQHLEMTVLSSTFFTSLVTSESAFCSLWTDSLSISSSPLFRTTDQTLFLDVFAGPPAGADAAGGGGMEQAWRRTFRGRSREFKRLVEAAGGKLFANKHQDDTNRQFDVFVREEARAGRMSLWKYRYMLYSSLWLTWFGNSVFGAIATFAGDGGRPADEWLRAERILSKDDFTLDTRHE